MAHYGWARIAQNAKKPSLRVNVKDLEFFRFNVSIWVPWSSLGPRKSCYIGRSMFCCDIIDGLYRMQLEMLIIN